MEEKESIAVRVIRGDYRHVDVSTIHLGLKSIKYIPLGVHENGSLVLANRSSLEKFLRRHAYFGRDLRSDFSSWQGPNLDIFRALPAGQTLTGLQYREIRTVSREYPLIPIGELVRRYCIYSNSALHYEKNFVSAADFKSIETILKNLSTRSEDDAANGYFEYQKSKPEDQYVNKDWVIIYRLAKKRNDIPLDQLVRDFFLVCDFATERERKRYFLWRKGSVFYSAIDMKTIFRCFERASEILDTLRRVTTKDVTALRENDLVKILVEIALRKPRWEAEHAEELKEGPIHISSNGDLLRSVIYFQGGKEIIILFNKMGRHPREFKAKGKVVGERLDMSAGSGADVVVKYAWKLSEGTVCVIAIQPNRLQARNELECYRRLCEKGFPERGIAWIDSWTMWESKWPRVPGTDYIERMVGQPRAWKLGVIMPYYPTDLSQVMTRLQASSVEIKLRIAIEFLEALSFLHGCDTVHGDLKSDNLFFSADGHLFIGDLRRTFLIGSEEEIVGGAKLYQPPEFSRCLKIASLKTERLQKLCRAQMTPALDIWAVGLILWQLFTTEIDENRAFGGMTWQRFVKGRCWLKEFPQEGHWLRTPPSSLEEVPQRIANLVRCCLCPSPKERWKTERLAEAFRVVLDVRRREILPLLVVSRPFSR